jgi:hypothetical protein
MRRRKEVAVKPMRALAWDYGCLAVQTLGGMIGPVTFVLADGRQVNPLHVAAWGHDAARSSLPGILQRLRGEWPCVPFGADADRQLSEGWSVNGARLAGLDLPHGYSSNADWRWIEGEDGEVALALDYPIEHPIRQLTRRIIPDPQAPAIDFELTIVVRRNCELPIGLHPVFRMPSKPGALRLMPGNYRAARTYPGEVEPGRVLFAEDKRFPDLRKAPRRDGGYMDASVLPFTEEIEDLVQLLAADGVMALHYIEESYVARLTWQPEHFPSLLLWFSNRGRRHYPWLGRHLALGVEPICSAFDLGTALSSGANPIAEEGISTARRLAPDEPFVTRYRIGVEA